MRYQGQLYEVYSHDDHYLWALPEAIASSTAQDRYDCTNRISIPLNLAEKLPPIKADYDTVLACFRLDTTPWDLARDGKYPFSPDSATIAPTIADILVSADRLRTADFSTLCAWERYFERKAILIQKEAMEATALLLLRLFSSAQRLTENGQHKDKYQKLYQQLMGNAAKPLSDWSIASAFYLGTFDYIEDIANQHPISAEMRELYVRLLDDESDRDEHQRTLYRGKAYLHGTSVIPNDWHKAERALLKSYDLNSGSDKAETALLLGHLYSSSDHPDLEKAFHYYHEAATTGNREARYQVAEAYFQGRGVPADHDQVMAWLNPLYQEMLAWYQREGYCNVFVEAALRLGYCARDGIGRKKSLRDAYCLFLQAKNAIRVRQQTRQDQENQPDNDFARERLLAQDRLVESTIDRALTDLLQIYSPAQEQFTGLIGRVRSTSERGQSLPCLAKASKEPLVRCLYDDGTMLLVRTVDAERREEHLAKEDFVPLAEHAHEVGDTVTLSDYYEHSRPATIVGVSWDAERGVVQYELAINGKMSEDTYSDWSFEAEGTKYAFNYMFFDGFGTCLFAANRAAVERWITAADFNTLPLSPELEEQLTELVSQEVERYAEQLTWNIPTVATC